MIWQGREAAARSKRDRLPSNTSLDQRQTGCLALVALQSLIRNATRFEGRRAWEVVFLFSLSRIRCVGSKMSSMNPGRVPNKQPRPGPRALVSVTGMIQTSFDKQNFANIQGFWRSTHRGLSAPSPDTTRLSMGHNKCLSARPSRYDLPFLFPFALSLLNPFMLVFAF